MYKSNCMNLYLLVEQNPVIPNINSGANITKLYPMSEQLYLYYYTCRYVCKHKHVILKNVLLAWHGLRTSLIWTVNKQGGIKKKISWNNWTSLKVLSKNEHNISLTRQKQDRTHLALPHFCHFSGPPCKVICVSMHTTRYTLARLIINKDRPRINHKTDIQCCTHKSNTTWLVKP